MIDEKQVWRLICEGGRIEEVIVEPLDAEEPRLWQGYQVGWSGRCVARTPRTAVTKVAGNIWPDQVGVLEILAPGQLSRETILTAARGWVKPNGRVDGDVIATVPPETIRADLRRLGFVQSATNDTGDFWRWKRDHFLALPWSQTCGDYAARATECVSAVARVENLSPIEVLARWFHGSEAR